MLIAITPSHLSATNFEKHAFTVVSTHCVLSWLCWKPGLQVQ
jgi:hypothetical protein